MSDEEARVVVEGLRSGIAYRETARSMTLGRERNRARLEEAMAAVVSGRRPPFWAEVIRGHYGDGKTHLLHALAAAAWDANWVVSLVAISKETPLDRLDYLYPKLMAELYRPGSNQPGVEAVVLEAVNAPSAALEAHLVELSPRTRAVLDSLLRQEAKFDELVGDVEGAFVPLTEIKRAYRENFSKPLKIPTSRIRDEIPYYFRLVDWLVHAAGYGGWLILFDEVELIGKFGRGARARAYANMGRFLEGVADHTLAVFALSGNFHTDVMIPRHEMEQAPAWLQARPREQADASLARLALEALADARDLRILDQGDLRRLSDHILDLHQAAYGWRAPIAPEAFHQLVNREVAGDSPLRVRIRFAMNLLDLWFQYEGEDLPAELTVGELATSMDLSEEREWEGGEGR